METSQANTKHTIQSYVEIFQIMIYIPTFILGLLFNGMAMWFAFYKIKQLTEPVIYMVSLMILDTLVLFALPFKIISYSNTTWNLGGAFCSFLESLYFVNMYGSILISTCICADRYIALLHPFVAVILRSPRKAAITCVIISAGIWAGTAYTYKFHEYQGPQFCFRGFSGTFWKNTVLLIFLETTFLACMTTMIFCTVQILIRLHRNRGTDDNSTVRSKFGNIVVANLATFLVCFTPFHVVLVLHYLAKNSILDDGQEIIRTFLQISLCWANLNCFLDAISYYFVFKESLKSPSKETNTTDVD
ncbi:G-protein coupled receptor 55 [Varanus komodoensis]|uniref:G-protein coupled receptors family 1 profile domain-containing protein n=1 Tax=Varanus komodoensis TaxID=61221 RepID=A0A8D2L499_VARKO|nr:G-protein coupled receptor 55-like [Varanus komodoensis]KAF7243305.1 G-protein coupled receptor 55 [Varanus komodoensis]